MLRLLRLVARKYAPGRLMPARDWRAGSPMLGSSTLMISAPKSPSIIVATAPGSRRVRSKTVIPSSGRIIVSIILGRLFFAGNRFLLLLFLYFRLFVGRFGLVFDNRLLFLIGTADSESLERSEFRDQSSSLKRFHIAVSVSMQVEEEIINESPRNQDAQITLRVIERLFPEW